MGQSGTDPVPLPRASTSNEKEPNSQTVEKYDHKHAKIVLSPQFSASPDDPVVSDCGPLRQSTNYE